MSDPEQRYGRQRLARRRRALGAPLGLLLIGIAALWAGRGSLARYYLDDLFARHAVPARYTITGIGPTRQSIEHVAIGDPAAPDLTADSVEIRLRWGWSGPEVSRIAATGVRLKGRLVKGRLSLGALDRLLPPPSGKPFTLPDMHVDLYDARMRLETPAGPVGLSLAGRGHLRGGFAGHLAAVASTLEAGGCRVTGANAFLAVSVRDRQPILDGPLRAAGIACAGRANVSAPWIALKARFAETLDRWNGAAGIASGQAAYGEAKAGALRGRLEFSGTARDTRGTFTLGAREAATSFAVASDIALSGVYVLSGGSALDLRGQASVPAARLLAPTLAPVHAALGAGAGTPVGPLGTALDEAIARAARGFAVQATALLAVRREGGTLALAALDARSASGARVTLGRGAGAMLGWGAHAGHRLDGVLTLAGGGLPDARISLRQSAMDAGLAGEAHIAPFAAQGARLALAPVRFAASLRRDVRFATEMLLDGPLADGRVTGLRLPIEGVGRRDGALLIGTRCAAVGFRSLAVAGLTLDPATFSLCPTGAALIARTGGQLRGGGTITQPRLTGRLGDSPVTIAARALRLDAAAPGFGVEALALRLGETRLDVARLDGKAGGGGLSGTFGGAAGRIAAVPLLGTDGAGDWRLADGALTLAGGLRLADAQADARFEPLASRDFRLRLKDRRIDATASLAEPASGRLVATVRLSHDLAHAQGSAVLAVPGLTFGPALQPEALTRLTLGVVANVEGTVKGEGRIGWGPGGVTSSGDFRSDRLDLAAAFGPVKGLAGSVHFTDLLALETAPGQEARIAEVNPGIAVTDGVVRYRLLAGSKVAVESGLWPLAGGTLALEPAVLDLGRPVARRLVFRVTGLDGATFIERFQLKDIAVSGTFDGVLPIAFGPSGGRIEGGHLAARPGGGKLAYVGQVSNERLGLFGGMAFDALKAIHYDALAIDLDGALDGEIVSRIRFSGVHEEVPEATAPGSPLSSPLRGLSHLPFKFNIVVRAPFRGLLNTATTFADPSGLLHGKPVQPQESDDKGEAP